MSAQNVFIHACIPLEPRRSQRGYEDGPRVMLKAPTARKTEEACVGGYVSMKIYNNNEEDVRVPAVGVEMCCGHVLTLAMSASSYMLMVVVSRCECRGPYTLGQSQITRAG